MAKHRKGSHEAEHENGEAWLLPYSDLMTLLLAVFIVLFAVSNMDESKAAAASQAFQGIMNGGSASPITGGAGMLPSGSNTINLLPDMPIATFSTTPTPTTTPGLGMDEEEKLDMEQVQRDLEGQLEQSGMEYEVKLYLDERGLIISLGSSILFDSGKADIKPDTQNLLMEIGDILGTRDYNIRVEGHTDNVPINSVTYPSNWELSGARAARVARLFIDRCGIEPEKLVSVGYGEFKPVADNGTYEGRAQNRRVDIIVLNTRFNALESQRSDVPQVITQEELETQP